MRGSRHATYLAQRQVGKTSVKNFPYLSLRKTSVKNFPHLSLRCCGVICAHTQANRQLSTHRSGAPSSSSSSRQRAALSCCHQSDHGAVGCQDGDQGRQPDCRTAHHCCPIQ
eukprot:g58564.t1